MGILRRWRYCYRCGHAGHHDSAANNFDSGVSELTGGTTQETRLPVDYGKDVSTLTIEPFFEGPAGSGQGGWTARRFQNILTVRIRLLCVITPLGYEPAWRMVTQRSYFMAMYPSWRRHHGPQMQ